MHVRVWGRDEDTTEVKRGSIKEEEVCSGG